jgi:phosphoenolpyruvate phosphomutase
VLAASRGGELRQLTEDRPKAMLSVNGRPMLARLVECVKKQGIDRVTVIGGYKADTIDITGIELLVNERHATSGELISLACARDAFCDEMVILYGDLVFRSYILRGLMESDRELTIVVDSQTGTNHSTSVDDYAYCSAPDDRSLWGQDVLLERLDTEAVSNGTPADGRWIGVLRARAGGRAWIEHALDVLGRRPDFDRLTLRDLLNEVVSAGHPVRVMYIHGHWLDVNSIADLERAGEFIAGHR